MTITSWLRYVLTFDFMFAVVAIIGFIQVYRRRHEHGEVWSEGVHHLVDELTPVFRPATSRLVRAPLRSTASQPLRLRFNKHEEKCRDIFQDIFRQPFPNIRPSWMINPITGECLELDGYCAEIQTPIGKGLAFEYDGAQHSRYIPHFHKNPYKFAYQVEKDKIKSKICEDRGVLLIRIPSFVNYHDLERYIRSKLAQYKLVSS